LGYKKQAAADIYGAQIHLALGIREDAQMDEFVGEVIGVFRGVGRRNSDERQNAAANAPCNRISHANLGPTHALYQKSHLLFLDLTLSCIFL
jgi:hypothetical protein